LRVCLGATGFLFGSGSAALGLIKYFTDALEIFYTTEELTTLLQEQGFTEVKARKIFTGVLGCHRARKPVPDN
jgi:demethylmenaquinone methyltransferase/2-methoxy-6-polyprenyl-1,4-benzoquinol methylase